MLAIGVTGSMSFCYFFFLLIPNRDNDTEYEGIDQIITTNLFLFFQIRSGYKLKYSSVAEVYTEVPSKLEEFFKQRRRWYLSSLAYFFFFISELKRFKFGNPHVTMPYLVYQGMLLCFPLVSTCTFGTVLASRFWLKLFPCVLVGAF